MSPGRVPWRVVACQTRVRGDVRAEGRVAQVADLALQLDEGVRGGDGAAAVGRAAAGRGHAAEPQQSRDRRENRQKRAPPPQAAGMLEVIEIDALRQLL